MENKLKNLCVDTSGKGIKISSPIYDAENELIKAEMLKKFLKEGE